MRPLQSASLIAITAASLASCGGNPFGPIDRLPRNLSEAEQSLIAADNAFGLKLFREVVRNTSDENLFISPLSVAMALGMAYNGADGTTRDGMTEALELQGMTVPEVNEAYRDLISLLLNLDPQVQFELANSIWYRNTLPVEQAFLDVNRDYFGAQVEALDFDSPSAASTINGWVSDHTAGKIESIVPDPLSPGMVMFLIDAIYFKGDWAFQFDKGLTQDAPFTLVDGTEVSVPTMSHKELADVQTTADELFNVIDLAYGGGAFSMTVLLPQQNVHIDSAVSRLDEPRWQSLIAGLDSSATKVIMPKFTTEYEITLNDVLQSLGMTEAFVPGLADFTGISANGGLNISEVKHKTFVDVNEEGTEAAAVTSVGIVVTCVCPNEFRIDRPFVYVIRERYSGSIIFMGTMLDPRS